jgi:hypothetical protein
MFGSVDGLEDDVGLTRSVKVACGAERVVDGSASRGGVKCVVLRVAEVAVID